MATRSELGISGLDEWNGLVREDFVTELNSPTKRYKAYNEMRLNSAVITGLLYAIEQGIRGVDWYFTSSMGEDDERVEFLEEVINSMSFSWNDHITEALTMLPFGFSVFEIVYEPRESGRIYWKKLALRGQDTIERWDLEDNGGIQGIYQRGAPAYNLIHIPIEKLVLYRTRVEKNNPEGRSVLRGAYRSHYFQKHIETFEGIGIERDLAGMPVVTLPPGADTTDSTTSDFGIAKKMVRNIRNDEQAGVVLPSEEWKLELLSTGSARLFDTNSIIQRHESRILISTLSQFLILGQDKVGTQALESGFGSRFNDSLDATADIIAATFTKYAAWRLLELNGMDTEGIKLEHSPAGDVDLLGYTEALSRVLPSITLFPQDEIHLRSLFGLPEVDEAAIQEEREAKEERNALMMQNMNRGRDERDEDEMSVYAAENAPDDDARRYYERRYARLGNSVLSDQFSDVKKGAKRMRRDAANLSG